MSLTAQTWAQHFLAVTENEMPKNTVPIWNDFMTRLVDALNEPRVDDELRQNGNVTVHFDITSEQTKLLQEEGSLVRIMMGLGIKEAESEKIGIRVRLFGVSGAGEPIDPRGECAEVCVYRTKNESKKPVSAPIPAGTLGPNRELEPDVDVPDCDTRLCETVQSVCLWATMHKDCQVADWFLGKAYIHKYTACEADFRKALETDHEFVAFLSRELKREEKYGPEAMRKMRPVEGDCIYELHTLVSEKVPDWPFGEPPVAATSAEIEPPLPEPATPPAPCPSIFTETTAAPAPSRSPSPPPWPWSFRSASTPQSTT